MYANYKKILNHKFLFNESVYNWLQTELSYTSNHIEGNTLTKRETMLAIEEGVTSGSKPIKDYLEAQNHARAFDYILSLKDKPIIDSYEKVILKIHELILAGINDAEKGKYRNVRVRISGSEAILPNPLKVPDLMQKFCNMLNTKKDSVLKGIEAHYKLVEIHPFIDGNGRTARLLMALILLRLNIIPLIIQPSERKRYLNCINLRNVRGKIFHYFNYMLRQLVKSVSIYNTYFGTDINDSKNYMKISEFSKFCNVPISTVRYYLRVKKISPIGYTNSGYMLFNKNQKNLIGKD